MNTQSVVTMKPADRRDKIVDLVLHSSRVSVEDLAETLNTSKETIRRDLTALADEGRIRKVHGSAVVPEVRGENAFHIRMAEGTAEKKRIAQRAAGLFKPGDTIFIDTGTTTQIFAEALADGTGLTIITNSTSIAQIIARGKGANKVYLLGGEYREESSQSTGSFTLEQILKFNASHAVLTVGAVSTAGFMDFALEEVDVARAMLQRARNVTILADSSKLDRQGLLLLCPLADVHRVVTDAAPEGELRQAFIDSGVEVIVAD